MQAQLQGNMYIYNLNECGCWSQINSTEQLNSDVQKQKLSCLLICSAPKHDVSSQRCAFRNANCKRKHRCCTNSGPNFPCQACIRSNLGIICFDFKRWEIILVEGKSHEKMKQGEKTHQRFKHLCVCEWRCISLFACWLWISMDCVACDTINVTQMHVDGFAVL